jgi:hypothetical protein
VIRLACGEDFSGRLVAADELLAERRECAGGGVTADGHSHVAQGRVARAADLGTRTGAEERGAAGGASKAASIAGLCRPFRA